ncbi:MAG: carbon-nitrogen hydrolase family protein [Kiloniellales bacterium]|nr:carbon-nitrogen hydrolase family protein [Kiloniellales bacterium]
MIETTSGRAFTAACVQLASDVEPEANVAAAAEAIRRARDAGADFVLTPETTDMLEMRRRDAFAKAKGEGEHPGLAKLRDLAAELGCWLLIGSLVIRLSDERLANRSFLIDPAGCIAARYDKIHMFDVEVPDGQSYRESRAYRPGGVAVLADLPWGRLGMTVCYDLRFPQLYRALAQAGAEFLTVPSAFTRLTGRAHWHVLLRARAIETGAFVLAPAQCGETSQGRQTYGHSLIVAPWGEVLAEAGEDPTAILAEIDPARVAEARRMIPALGHDRPFEAPT